MVKVIDGDLFDSKARFICHQVNCQGKMGSGVAKQVKERYPHVYAKYHETVNNLVGLFGWSGALLGATQVLPTDESKPMDLQPGCFPDGVQFIVNMFAQDKYGYDRNTYTSIDALYKCMKCIAGMVHEKNFNFGATIAMPWKIGCCRGGADWDTVYKMIEEVFADCNVELWRCDKG